MTIRALTVPTVVRAAGDEPEIVISTAAVDREGDILEPDGAELADYQKNPVVGYGHFRHETLPIAATTSITREPGRGLRARWRWLEGDAFAERVRNAWEQGVLRAASVGFLPLDFEPRTDGRGLRYTRWSLLEWSLVPIPANPEAVRSLKALGLPVTEAGDDVVLVLRDEPLPESTSSTWPSRVVDARDLLRDYLGSVTDATDARFDPLRDADASITAFLEALSAQATGRGASSRRMSPQEPERFAVDRDELADVVRTTLRDTLGVLVARETRAAVNQLRGRID